MNEEHESFDWSTYTHVRERERERERERDDTISLFSFSYSLFLFYFYLRRLWRGYGQGRTQRVQQLRQQQSRSRDGRTDAANKWSCQYKILILGVVYLCEARVGNLPTEKTRFEASSNIHTPIQTYTHILSHPPSLQRKQEGGEQAHPILSSLPQTLLYTTRARARLRSHTGRVRDTALVRSRTIGLRRAPPANTQPQGQMRFIALRVRGNFAAHQPLPSSSREFLKYQTNKHEIFRFVFVVDLKCKYYFILFRHLIMYAVVRC